jgi:flagellar basal-body rod modification protein FlgD
MSISIGQTSTAQTAAAASTATSSSSSSSSTTGTNGTVDQSEFMQLLIAQLQNQDPTQPVQGTEFVTQLAQFALVQQASNQSQALSNLSTQITGLSNNQTTNLIGQTVTVSGSTASFNGTSATPVNVTLASAAANVSATITDSSGDVIQTMNLGPHAAGAMSIPWNGQTSGGGVAPVGSYTVNVSATDGSGQSVAVSQNVTGVVQNVSFSQGYPELTLSSGAQAPISQLVSVGASTASP